MKSKEELKQYRTKTLAGLYKDLQVQYQKLQKQRFSAKFRKLKDTSQIRKTREAIARILSIIREKLEVKHSPQP